MMKMVIIIPRAPRTHQEQSAPVQPTCAAMAAVGLCASDVVPKYDGRANANDAAMSWAEEAFHSAKHVIAPLPPQHTPEAAIAAIS